MDRLANPGGVGSDTSVSLPLAIVSSQEKNKQLCVIKILISLPALVKGSLLDLTSLNSGQTPSCIFNGRCFVFPNYFPESVAFSHVVYYWAFGFVVVFL